LYDARFAGKLVDKLRV